MGKKKAFWAIIDILDNTKGRDKTFHTFQYVLGMISASMAHGAIDPIAIERARLLSNNGAIFSTTRKLLRFFQHKALFQRLRKTFIELSNDKLPHKDRVYYRLRVVSDIIYFFFLLDDHILMYHKMSPFKSKKLVDFLNFMNSFPWLIQSFIDLICNLMKMREDTAKGREEAANRKKIKCVLLVFDMLVS